MNGILQNLSVDTVLRQALQEDIGNGDISTDAVLPAARCGTAELLCRQDGILAGMDVFARVFSLLDSAVQVHPLLQDGQPVHAGDCAARLTGDMRVLLSGERTALNFLQRMSGIATYTHAMVQLLAGTRTVLVDTRKTTPNLRLFEKYAVRVGGARNHRFHLSDGVLLKDNHIGAAGGVARAVELARAYVPFGMKIEVETETLDMVRQALAADADIIMLDNMPLEQMRLAVLEARGRALVECSGNFTLENLAEVRSLEADFVSSGALTHSAPILDFSLKHLHPLP